eukprot:8671188-Pyramimonas_sp.AAC.2
MPEECKKWKHYLIGSSTDHKPLQYLHTQPNLSNRQARWLGFLAEYDLVIEPIKGADNIVGDALSRRPDYHRELSQGGNVGGGARHSAGKGGDAGGGARHRSGGAPPARAEGGDAGGGAHPIAPGAHLGNIYTLKP